MQRDSVMRPWTIENGELHSPQDAKGPQGHQTFVFPIPHPAENYDLRYRVTRNKFGFTMMFPFIDGDEPADLHVDGGPAGKQPFAISGDNTSSNIQEKLWFPPGETHEVIIEVRENSVCALYDGHPVVNLSRTPPHGQGDRYFFPPDRLHGPIFGIAVCAGDITVHSAEYRVMNVDAFAVQPAPAVPVAPGRAATPAAPIPAAVAASRFVPELAPIADKYHANLAALRAQAEEAMAWLKNAYLTQLSAADQGATAAGQIKIVAAILEERKSMQDGLTMSTVLPPDLPAALNGPRQTYIAGFRKLSADSALGRQRLDTDYLRDLGTLGARAPGGSEFAKQVEEEKALLVRNAPTAVVAAVEAAPPQSGSNRVVNGNFGDAAPDGFPKGWLFTNTAWIDPRTFDRKFTPSGLNIRAVQDGGETFVRCSYAMERGYIGQMVEIPPHKKEIVFKFHVRGKQPGKPDSMEAGFRFFSKDHKFIPEPQNLYPVRKTSPNAWHPFEFVCKLPVQAEYACIVMGSGDLMEGVYEFQRVEVGFR